MIFFDISIERDTVTLKFFTLTHLLASADYRYGGGDIGAGRIDLYQSHSDDNGLTWSEPGHLWPPSFWLLSTAYRR